MIWREIKRITVSSLIAMLVYLFINIAIASLLNLFDDVVKTIIKFCLYSFTAFAFAFSYIAMNFLRNGKGEVEIWRERKEHPDIEFQNSIMTIIKQEKYFIITLFCISMLCWLCMYIDSFIHTRFLSFVILFYFPLFVMSDILPTFAGFILSYIITPILITMMYILLLKRYRKKWLNSFNKEGEKYNGKQERL